MVRQEGVTVQDSELRRISKQGRRKLTDDLRDFAKLTKGWQYAAITNATYSSTLGADADALKEQLGIGSSGSIRDNLPELGLALLVVNEQLTREAICSQTLVGHKAVIQVTRAIGHSLSHAIEVTRTEIIG